VHAPPAIQELVESGQADCLTGRWGPGTRSATCTLPWPAAMGQILWCSTRPAILRPRPKRSGRRVPMSWAAAELEVSRGRREIPQRRHAEQVQ